MKTQTIRKLAMVVLLALACGTSVSFGFYDSSMQRWINRDPDGEKDSSVLYLFAKNNAVNSWDIFGLRTAGIAGKIVVADSCASCPAMLSNFRYIPEDNPGGIFTLTPIAAGQTYEADALYAPVGIAWKIGDPGQITINCNCKCKRVEMQGTRVWLTESKGPPFPANWPGGNPVFSSDPPGFDALLLNGGLVF